MLIKSAKERLMFCKILVPLDGSDLAAKILPQVEDLAKTCKSEKITLITAGIAPTNEDFSYSGLDKYAAAIRTDSEKKLAAYEAEMKAKGLNVNSVYLEGEPAQTILAYAADNEYDLIAMATHGRGEMAWVIGSVAVRVAAHATMPVLLMRVLDIGEPITKKDYAAMDTGDVLA
jgi:nucleotide-binding universal stress UspA family protein